MPRSCTICEHPEREAIDRALVGETSNLSVSSLFGVSESAVLRHKANHLPAKLVMAEHAAEVAEADNLLDSFWCEIEERTTVGIGWPFWLRVWSASSITETPMFELWYPGWPSGPPSPPIYRSPPRLYPDNGPGIRGAS